MKFWKKFVSLGLIMSMSISLMACGGAETTETTETVETTETAETVKPSGEKRVITIGTWYDHFYDSTQTDIYENPYVTDEEQAQMQLDNVRAIEEKYNVEIKFVNLTYQGVQDSINTSILAGAPDCDIYEVDLQFGIPAALNGYATDLSTVLPEDSDIFADQNVMKYIQIGESEEAYLMKAVAAETTIEATYPLAFNKQMLDDAGLEDPRDLYARGEWTWDKFREYMLTLTKDSDGDGVVDVYGFGSDYQNLFGGLLMSNGATVASGTTQTVTNPEVGEVLEYMYNMYNVDKSAYPWYADDFDTNRLWYKDGLVGFWVTAAWIMDSNKDADLEFDVCMVPWPVGPSGNQETNKMKNVTSGNAWMIPSGVEDPEFVYNVFYDWTNWYNFDTEYRDSNLSWWEDAVITEENFAVMEELGARENFDLWNNLGVAYDLEGLITGVITPSQFQETYKQLYQDALDAFFK